MANTKTKNATKTGQQLVDAFIVDDRGCSQLVRIVQPVSECAAQVLYAGGVGSVGPTPFVEQLFQGDLICIVACGAAHEHVFAELAVERVFPTTGDEDIAGIAGDEVVFAIAAGENTARPAGLELVVARATEQDRRSMDL